MSGSQGCGGSSAEDHQPTRRTAAMVRRKLDAPIVGNADGGRGKRHDQAKRDPGSPGARHGAGHRGQRDAEKLDPCHPAEQRPKESHEMPLA